MNALVVEMVNAGMTQFVIIMGSIAFLLTMLIRKYSLGVLALSHVEYVRLAANSIALATGFFLFLAGYAAGNSLLSAAPVMSPIELIYVGMVSTFFAYRELVEQLAPGRVQAPAPAAK